MADLLLLDLVQAEDAQAHDGQRRQDTGEELAGRRVSDLVAAGEAQQQEEGDQEGGGEDPLGAFPELLQVDLDGDYAVAPFVCFVALFSSQLS
jgi:hypothetical protein